MKNKKYVHKELSDLELEEMTSGSLGPLYN